ncbi:aspartate carbamoyltransferase [Candidatus Uhrbacteria bacterium]|nr:aspartate carbamoyltransferase [Candidatus Uhrbacteria bacterium]
MAQPFTLKNIISIADFSKQDILTILKTAREIQQGKISLRLLEGVLMATCFFEASTRTRLSFEAAIKRMGGDVIGFADAAVTSTKKGETLADSIKIIGQYVDGIIIRHPLDGSARLASCATDKPVINAGDGSNQHPTQTLLDLYTIKESQKKLDELTIVFAGDLKYGRTVHSLAQALTHFNVRLYFVAPPSLQLPPHIADDVKGRQIKFSFHDSLDGVLQKADVVYMTRMQAERFSDTNEYMRVKNMYELKAEDLKGVKKNLAILHPLPRVAEVHTSVDTTPHAWYFRQANNGVVVRQALLAHVFGKL